MKLGGTMILHNAVRFDYCVKEALTSLCRACDEVVVLECESTDETPALLESMIADHPNLRVIKNEWAVRADKHRLSVLTNIATEALSKDVEWLFNLQADEVIADNVDKSIILDAIRVAVSRNSKAVQIRRINLWGDFDHHFSDNYPNKPVSNHVVRIVHRSCKSVGDAESFSGRAYLGAREKIIIVHYGFLRDPVMMIDKTKSMQGWFGFGIDKKMLEQEKTLGRFNPEAWHQKVNLAKRTVSHPEAMAEWISEREGYYV